VRQFEGLARVTKLEALNAARRLDDLAKPNRLETLRDNLKGLSLDPDQSSMARDLQMDKWRTL
jgi:hypothetical protein